MVLKSRDLLFIILLQERMLVTKQARGVKTFPGGALATFSDQR